jgi:hypothetical protein
MTLVEENHTVAAAPRVVETAAIGVDGDFRQIPRFSFGRIRVFFHPRSSQLLRSAAIGQLPHKPRFMPDRLIHVHVEVEEHVENA